VKRLKVFYATGFAITFNEEAFLVELEFSTETKKETFCLVVSPSGAKTLQQALEEKIAEYEAQFKAKVKPWAKDKPKQNNNANYLS
jgi:hypothetical protein